MGRMLTFFKKQKKKSFIGIAKHFKRIPRLGFQPKETQSGKNKNNIKFSLQFTQ